MKDDTLKIARKEAKRFLNRIIALEKRGKQAGEFYSTKESGAVRRASMDLTRALADYRR